MRTDARTLLAVGYASGGTGFGRVLSSILSGVAAAPPLDGWEVHQFELAHLAERTEPSWQVHPNQRPDDPFGLIQLPALLDEIKPDLVFVVVEPWVAVFYARCVRQAGGNRTRIVAYTPIDGTLQDCPYLHHLGDLDQMVLYTRAARKALGERLQSMGGRCPPLRVIPHGVDLAAFQPYARNGTDSGRRRARRELWPDQPDLWDAFIVLNANRNQPRKQIATTIEGFARFARGKPPNVRLYLHMGVLDEGVPVIELARQHGIEDRLLLTERQRRHPRVTDARLNCIYNACDVGINTSAGEGWGLCAFEHAATGAAQVVPRHTGCEENWSGAALLVEPAQEINFGNAFLTGFGLEPEAVAQALNRLYEDTAFRETMAARAFQRATEGFPNWTRVAEHFRDLFDAIVQPGAMPEPARQLA